MEIEGKTDCNDEIYRSVDLNNEEINLQGLQNVKFRKICSKTKEDIDRYYPGGLSFLEESKDEKIENIFELSTINAQFDEIRGNIDE